MPRKSPSQLKVTSNSESGKFQPREPPPPQSLPLLPQSLLLPHQPPQSTTMMRNPDTHGPLTAPPLKVKPNMLTARTQSQQLSKSFMDHPTHTSKTSTDTQHPLPASTVYVIPLPIPGSKTSMLLTLKLCILKIGASETILLLPRKSAQMSKHQRSTPENMPGKRTTASPQNKKPPMLSVRITKPGKTSKSFTDHPTLISNNFMDPPTLT